MAGQGHNPPLSGANAPVVRRSPATLWPDFFYAIYAPRAAASNVDGFIFPESRAWTYRDGVITRNKHPYGPDVQINNLVERVPIRIWLSQQIVDLRFGNLRAMIEPADGQPTKYEFRISSGTYIDNDPPGDPEKIRVIYDGHGGDGGTRTAEKFQDGTWQAISFSPSALGFDLGTIVFIGSGALIEASINSATECVHTYNDPSGRYTGSMTHTLSGDATTLADKIADPPDFGSWFKSLPNSFLAYTLEPFGGIPRHEAIRNKVRIEFYLPVLPPDPKSYRISGKFVKRRMHQRATITPFNYFLPTSPLATRIRRHTASLTLTEELFAPVDAEGSMSANDSSWEKFGYKFQTSLQTFGASDRAYWRFCVGGPNGPYTVTWQEEIRQNAGGGGTTSEFTSHSETLTRQGQFWRGTLRYTDLPMVPSLRLILSTIVVKDKDDQTVFPFSSIQSVFPQPILPFSANGRWAIELKLRQGNSGYPDFTQFQGTNSANYFAPPVGTFRRYKHLEATIEYEEYWEDPTADVPIRVGSRGSHLRGTIIFKDTWNPELIDGSMAPPSFGFTREIVSRERVIITPEEEELPVEIESGFNELTPLYPRTAAELASASPAELSFVRETITPNTFARTWSIRPDFPGSGGDLQEKISEEWFDEVVEIAEWEETDTWITTEKELPFVEEGEYIVLEDVTVKPVLEIP